MGQNDFRPGFVINSDFDTLSGYLDYRGDLRNSKMCVFKADKKANPVNYGPEDILAYRFDKGKYYVSKTVPYGSANHTLFVEYLVDGIADLYYFRDELSDHYILEQENGRMIPLTNETKVIQKDGKEYGWDGNEHIRVLKATFSDCMEIQPKIDRATLSHGSLIKITSDYHGYVCEDEDCLVFQKEIPILRIEPGIDFGYATSGFRFTGHHLFGEIEFPRSLDPVFGLNLSLSSPRLNERFSLLVRTEYTGNEFYQYEQTIGPTGALYHEDIFFSFTTIRLISGLQYRYPSDRLMPVFGAGIVYNFFREYDFQTIITPEVDGVLRDPDYGPSLVANHSPGIFAQLGMDINLIGRHHLYLHVRFHTVPSLLDEKNQYNSLAVSLGYHF